MTFDVFAVFWEVSAWLGIVAAAGLLYRMVSTWDDMTPLSKILGALATSTIGMSSYASYRLSKIHMVHSLGDVSILLFTTRAAGFLVFLLWPVLLRWIDNEGGRHR